MTSWNFRSVGTRVLLITFLLTAVANGVEPYVTSTRCIWDAAPHNAFTDLVRWRGKFYCAFREGQGHAGDRGKLRIICSQTDVEASSGGHAVGEVWKSVALLSMDEFDLRDAALSVTPDDRLMVLGGAQQEQDGQRRTGTFVSFSTDGKRFSDPKIVIPLGRWLWRVTWQGDTAYGVAYGADDDRAFSSLLKTKDGVHYETVSDRFLAEGGWPTEARLRFAEDGTAYCLHRRDGVGNSAYLGTSQSPYKDWQWTDLEHRLGGPDFLQLPNGQWIGAGRRYDGKVRTELVRLDVNRGVMSTLLSLPSGGDTSYPGMVWHDDRLWISYYASHEGKTKIYLAQVSFPEISTKPIALENRLELFVDRHLIADMQKARLKIHHPRPQETVLQFDKPWEGAFCGYATVIQDTDRLRMYYRGLPQSGLDATDAEVTCYAESRDGIEWTKPDLGLYEIAGTRDNNVVLSGHTPASHNFSPFLDKNPEADPQQRYKALGGTADGLLAFASPDGIRWKRLQQDPVFTKGVFDSQNVAFYSQHEQQYVCYFRTWTKGDYGGFRTVSRTTSRDFLHWTDPVTMAFGDRPWEHLYTNQTSAYFRAPHIYVGVAARFMPGRQVLTPEEAQGIGVDPKYFGDVSDAVLLTSRGGAAYDRTFMESWIRPGLGLQNWVSRTNYPALGIVATAPHELSLYIQKNYGQPSANMQRYTLRTDGFASAHAGYEEAELTSKPITFAADTTTRLMLNYATSAAGSVRVELQDEEGDAIPGFELSACRTMIGDRISQTVHWPNAPALDQIAGKSVRIRFAFRDADLYSFQFKSDED